MHTPVVLAELACSLGLQQFCSALHSFWSHQLMTELVLQSLVETAMLAAVSGLAYTLATLLKLDSYLGYFLPMPVIVAAMRSGPASGRKTMTATCFLLLCKRTLVMKPVL